MKVWNIAKSAGFSLVEVALALLVASIGLLSVFALFPAGLDMNKRAIDDSQVGLYAQEVFNGLQYQMMSSYWSSNQYKVRCAATDIWSYAAGDPPGNLWVRSGTGTNAFRYALAPEIVDYAMRYELSVSNLPGSLNIKYARLRLWNGETGSTNAPAIFYTEFYNPDLEW